MADLKISQLPEAAALTSAELAPLVQSGGNVKATIQQITTAVTGATGTNGETVTTDKPRLNLTQTWNAVGTTFTGLKFNATNTASAAASNLMVLQTNGANRFAVNPDGFIIAGGSNSEIRARSVGTGFRFDSFAGVGSNYGFTVAPNSTTNGYTWGNEANNPTVDLGIFRDAADTLAQRRTTNAQTFRIYNTFTDASNYERGFAQWSGNVFQIGAEAAGTGTQRVLGLKAAGGATLDGLSLTGAQATSLLDMAATWNTTGAPAGIKLNITNTASAVASSLIDLQIGGFSRFKVDQYGVLKVFVSPGFTNEGIEIGATNSSAQTKLTFKDGLFLSGAGAFDVVIRGDGAADTLAQRRTTNAQTFRIYNTFTDASNYERGKMEWDSNVLRIGTEKAGTGTARALALQADGTTRLTINADGSISLGGNSVINTSGTYQAGGTGTPSVALASTGLFIGSTEQVKWSSTAAWTGALDSGLARSAANVVGVTNGSTGGGAMQFVEMTAPAAPAANGVRIYAEDDGAGKTRLMALFATGAAQQIAIEP